LAAGASLTIKINVTSSTFGTHINITSDLTSSHGIGGTATANLTVTASTIYFSKPFSNNTIKVGEKTTLTYVIHDEHNGGIYQYDFT
jgi:uncharacterized glyoxalase superfamily protein PhnB